MINRSLKLRLKSRLSLLGAKPENRRLMHAFLSEFRGVDSTGCDRTIIDTLTSVSSSNTYNRQFDLVDDHVTVAADSDNDTLFMLAGGPSVNTITEEEWHHIGSCSSWGMNLWVCHEFVPSVYFPQVFPSPVSSSWDKAMYEGFQSHSEDLRHCEFIIRGDWVSRKTVHTSKSGGYLLRNHAERTSILSEFALPENFAAPPTRVLDFFSKHSMFDGESASKNFVPKYGNTLMLMVTRAIQLGYRKIVFCGVEMDSNAHFFDEEPYVSRFPDLREISSYYLGQEQPIFNSSSQRHNRTKVLSDFAKYVDEKFSVKLFIAKDVGLLKDVFPVYEF